MASARAAMTAMSVVGLVASAGLFLLGALGARHLGRVPAGDPAARGTRGGHRDPVALPFTLLAWDMALWTLATTLHTLSGEPAWHWLDVTFSPLTPPLTLHLVLAYTGTTRRYKHALVLAYTAFTALAASSASAFIQPWARAWVDSSAWSLAYLVGWLPINLFAAYRLVVALRASRDVPLAAMRARLLIAALVLAGVLGATEMLDDLLPIPSLGVVGALIAMVLMAAVVLRFELLVGTVGRTLLVYAVVVAIVAVTALAVALAAPGLGITPLLAIVVVIVATLALAVREVVRAGADRRARASYLSSLGRFSAQMAHDLKNPLAAMKGAVQYLEAERGVTADTAEPDMLALLGQQIARLEVIIDRYRRLARTEPIAALVDPAALTDDAARATRAESPAIEVVVDALATGLWRGDPDLIASVLENLLANARDALQGCGRITLRVRRDVERLTLEVEDDGPGIDPRYLDRVRDDFFTTKADGSGLGLAFVRRVAVAHGGALEIDSHPGRGTCVRVTLMELPEPR